MSDTLSTSLLITAIGMTLLFLTLAFFYGLLTLITATIRDRPVEPEGTPDPQASTGRHGWPSLEAAAVAVALARAQASQPDQLSALHVQAKFTGGQDPWWLLHHQAQLSLNPDSRRRR